MEGRKKEEEINNKRGEGWGGVVVVGVGFSEGRAASSQVKTYLRLAALILNSTVFVVGEEEEGEEGDT